MIAFSRPVRSPLEDAYLQQALDSGHAHGDGPFTERASRWLSERHRGAEVLLTPSATHALELSALLLDLGPDDDVVVPSFTFTSTANAFALRGARIRFADVDPGTFTMGLAEMKAAVTDRTRCVVVVHYGGVSPDIGAIADFCQVRGIALVEDNAHGLFGMTDGRPLGTFGTLAALSFHGTKNVSCGEGGALLINDPTLLRKAEMMREKGTDRAAFFRGEVDKYRWRTLGSSWLLADVLAALLLAQLENSDWMQKRRQTVWSTYQTHLEPVARDLGVTLQRVPARCEHPAHLFALLVSPHRDRERVLARCREAGFYAVSHYEPLHLAPIGLSDATLPVTADIAPRLVRLPVHAGMEHHEAVRVAERLVRILEPGRST